MTSTNCDRTLAVVGAKLDGSGGILARMEIAAFVGQKSHS